jgi:hypothetical protein
MERITRSILILIFGFFGLMPVNLAQSVEQELDLLKGSFAGEWSTFKNDIHGDIVPLATWKDTLIFGKITQTDSMVHCRTQVSYTFDHSAIPPTSMRYLEGFYYEGDSVTSHFFSSGGNIIPYIKIAENTYSYTQEMHPNEFIQFRFMSGVKGSHTQLKVVSYENNREVHHYTRVTTIISMDSKGNESSRQFVSLKGVRKRIE